MTKEEAKRLGLQLLHGIMERNESYPVYANNVKQAIDALSGPSGSSEIQNDLAAAAIDIADSLLAKPKDYVFSAKADYWNGAHDGVIAGAKWQKEQNDYDTIFYKGMMYYRKQMLEEAVEGEITKDNRGNNVVSAGVFNKDFEYGDKVRVIVCKKED